MIGVIFHMNSNFKRFWPRTNGIYKITNRKTGRFYIGKAADKQGFYKRWSKHRSDLREKIHCCSYLQHSFDKHGEDCFTFEILELKSYGEPLLALESEYIVNLKSMYFQDGYNLRHDQSIEEYPGVYRENHPKAKEFEILDPEGNLIKGKNLSQFCEERGLPRQGISNVVTGAEKSCKGWKSVNPSFHVVKKEYRMLSPEKELIIFDNMAEFARKIGAPESSVVLVCQGKYSNTKGYHLENPSPEHQKNLDRLFNKKLLLNKDIGIISRFVVIKTFASKYSVPCGILRTFFEGRRKSSLTKNYNWSIPTEEDMQLYPIVDETF
jgi:group I intron endonuclease